MDDGRKDDCCLCELCERHSVIWLWLCCVDLNRGGGLGLCPGSILLGGVRKEAQEWRIQSEEAVRMIC
jgi:hypothetical protein